MTAARRRRWRAPLPRRGTVLAVALAAAVVAAAATGIRLAGILADNRLIAGLAAGRELAVDPGADPAVLLARADFLLTRDRIDEAQALLAAVVASGDPGAEQAMRYNLANARLRRALVLLGENRIDAAVPLVNLAKDDYRRALMLDPGDWNAKYNLDVAMRLVRDFPAVEVEGDEEPPGAAKLWTELPGLPKGMP